MAGCSVTEESEVGGGRFPESILSGQQREAMAEWRSSEQVENGIPSTSPPYWDIEDDEGQKPCELYGKYTWKIDKFSQINKRELRSNAFEVGGYKWYILIYPQGCDVCNHLSLFLCVANHDKLLPGWSHFAQFTIAVVNKDPKKSKYSDTLHRFWKKEHDWGWKKFMELSKVLDGFIDADTLIIKAQVQVIRERAERPFRCLDIQYRRELVRVYLTNVEQICRRFVEERRTKLVNLIADKAKWTSFCAFWLGMDQNARRRMSREKTDVILKVVVKSFFIEKEVTSTLVMDSLYSGLKALEGQSKSKKEKGKSLDTEEELINPVIRTEKDMFVLIDDVLLLLERVAMEPLPPKDEKGPQNRTKDGSCGEDFNKDSIERDERRLTELGRRTIEIYVLAHIFSTKIEIAYQEAVAFKRQEELIREEEAAAWLAGSEKKTKKEKKSKKKQSKQKRNNSKSKDKGRDEKIELIMQDLSEDSEVVTDKIDVYVPEDVLDIYESLQVVEAEAEAEAEADSEERDVSPVNWDTDTSEVNPPTEASSSGVSVVSVVQTTPSLVDDTSSTCSTDSVVSGVINGDHLKNQKSPTRGQNHRSKASGRSDWGNGTHNEPFQVVGKANRKIAEQHVRKAEEVSHVRKGNGKNEVDAERPSMKKKSVSSSPSAKSSSTTTVKNNGPISIPTRKPSSESPKRIEVETVVKLNKSVTSKSLEKPSVVPIVTTDKPSTQQKVPIVTTDKPSTQQKVRLVYDKPSTQQKVGIVNDKPSIEQVRVGTNDKASSEEVLAIAAMSRPLSAPGTQQPEASASVAVPVASSSSTTTPLLARSVSATGRLGPSDTISSSSYISQSQSYRNAMMGVNPPVSGTSHHHHYPTSSPTNSYSQPQAPTRMESSFSYGGGINHDGHQWVDHSSQVINEIRNFDLYSNNRFHDNHHHLPSEVLEACTSGRQTHQVSGGGGGGVGDEFPHLDIINDLLDEDQNGIGSSSFYGGSQYQQLNRQLSYPGEIGPSRSSSSNSSFSRFERTRSYNEDVYNQRGYEGGPFDQMRDMFPPPHSNNASYTTNRSHIDGVIPIPQQWQMPPSVAPASDLSYLSNEYNNNNNINNSYSYHVPDYSSSNRGGAYALFRPSTGL